MEQQLYFPEVGEPKQIWPHRTVKDKAHPAQPGSGPMGEFCRTCSHRRANETRARNRFWKCNLMRRTSGSATDIRMRDPACSRWEKGS